MLENLVAWILNNYIGEYFCLNTDQLSVAFLQGQVDLENVPLRTSSLRKFDIPLQVKHGLIGKLQLQVPLTRIRSQPWILRIRDFLVLLGPYSSNYDVEIVEQYKQQNLEKMLDELEIEQKKKLLSQLGIKFNENDEQNSWWGTTSLLSSISSNIQILLENVHIKYESSDFNFGVQIDSLHVQTTNFQWHVGFVEPTDGKNIFKKIDVKGFSIYWNPENTSTDSPIVLPLSLESLKGFFSSPSENAYILQPFTLELRMEKNSSRFPLRSTLLPRFKFNIRSQRIELELTQKQISQIQQFMDDWAMFERARPHRKWRPRSSIINSPRRWWQFAINRQLEQIRNKNICREPKTLFARLHLVNTYCRAYRHRLNCFLTSQRKGSQNVSSPSLDANKLNPPKYSHEETTLLKQIEHGADFSYSDLHILREAVFQKMLTELKQQFSNDNPEVSRTESPFQIIESEQVKLQENVSKISQQQNGGGWLNWMTNWFGAEENLRRNKELLEENADLLLNDSVYLNNLSTPKLNTPRHALSPELEEIEKRMQTEILQMLNDSLDDYNILRRDNLLAELILNFARVHLRIAADKSSKEDKNDEKQINSLMLTFDLDQLNGRIHISPKEHRTEMSITVGDLSIQQMQQQQYLRNQFDKKKDSSDSSKTTNNEESLFCGFQNNVSNSDISTSLLFTIGRRSEKNIKPKNFSPMLELFYKRLAPKMEIYHELNICCAPLAMIADDCFISALQEICCMENKTFQHSTSSTSNFSTFSNNSSKSSDETSLLLHQIFISATIPELLIELRSQKAARDCILSTLSKPAENNSFLQTHTKKRKRATNSVLLPLNFDINDIYNNNNDFEEEYIVEENEHNINQNINKNKNIKKEETNKTKISTKTSFKNKLVSTTTSNITNSQHSNLTTATTINSTSSPFVLASICGLSFTFIKKDLQQQKLNKINVGFDSINLKDLFETTTTTTNDESLLLRIGKEKKLKSDKNGSDGTFRSLSCPDLTTNSSKHANNISINETIETSDSINLISNLPSTSLLEENLIVIEKENVGRHQTMPTIKQQIDNNIPNIKQNPKKNHSVEIVFIPNIQEGFETKYKKANCIVTGNFDEQTGVELFINRRTWLLFMDFFGFCSSSDINKNVLNNNNYIMRVELNVSNLILSMNYPKSEFTPKLGIVYIQKPKFITQIDLNVLSDPILIWMQAHSFSLTDENGLFSQRLRVGNFDKSNGKSPPCIQLKLVKNRRSMTSLPNEFDIHLTLNVDSNIVNYIHSHRYYYALLDFWLQFAELYDRLCIENEMQKQKPSQKNSQDANNLLKLRCKLDIDFTSGFRLYLPSSERSSLAVLFECDKVNISNQFCRASQIKNLLQKHLGKQQFNASNGSSLLLDDINIKIQHFSIYYGNFCVAKNIRSKNERTSTKDDFTAYTFHKLQSAIGSDIDGNTNHNMEMQIYRNLSVRASHAVPDTFVIFRLENLTINCTSEFYKLLHVCVNNNFGEQLILQPETIPIELLELPEIDLESLEKYATFCVRLKLKGVQLNLLTPTSPFETNSFEKFATFSLQSVKVLFDSFIDSHSEIDIICKNATLEDSTNSDNTAEPFKKLLKARHEKGFNKHVASSSTNKNIESKKLLCELHIQMARDECQIFSFILIKTRVFLLFEWIEKLKLFLLLVNSNSNEFSSKSGIHCRSSTNQQQQKYSKKHSSSSQKELLNQSSSSNNNQNNRITSMFKITLKDCELIILEDSSKSDSFGLIANTSGVILYNLYDNSNELFDIQCEIQNFSISWCLMNTEKSSLTQITNESNATININISDNKTSITNERKEKTLKTTDGIEHLILKQLQNIQINLGPLIIRISLKDYFIVKYIIDKSLITWEKSQNQKFFWSDSSFANKNIHQIKQGEENQRVTIPKKWRLNADQLCIWLLKETTSSTSGSVNNIGISMAPFLRFNLFELYTHWTSRHTEINFAVSIDNYRERPPLGWEPLLERWRIARLELDEHSQQKWNLWLRSADESIAELNITQTFLEELIDFIAMNNELFKQTTNNKTLNSFNDLIEETRNEHSKCPKTSIIENNSFSESYKVQKQKHSNSASFSAKQRSNSGTSTSSRSNAFDPIRISHPSGIDLDIQLDLPAGIGISLIGNSCENNDSADELQQEELIYARFYSVRVGVQRRQNNTYVCSCSSQSIQFDNQILGADRHNLFFCDPNALRGPYPALNFEMSYTSTDILDAYESFRLKLCNSCVLLDEQLLWRLINFGKNIIDYRRNKLGQQQHQTQQVTKNCYFGAFQLEFGDISLSVLTIDKNALPPRLRLLKEKYAETLLLVNFENALVTLAPFWAHRCLTTFNNLFANIVDFYIGQLKRQKLSIFVAMDAIGNPLGFANEFKEGFEGLLFEGDVAGFTFGIGYGAANSISKVASSMAQGVGALTFDDQHEQFRRWMLRSKPEQEANALAYLYGGLKGFGVGVFGGLTAIARNTVVAARQEGVLPGVIRGVTTGAVDTFTKPLQGTLDLVEGTASAIREVVGAPLVRRAHFPKRRLRSPRVCSSMSGLLPSYSNELAEAQQDLLRITGTYALNDDNRLLSIVPFYERFTPEGWIIRHRALIVPSQSYICRNIIEGGEDYNFEEKTIVTHRILFEHLKNVQISSSNQLSLNKHKRSSSSSNLKTTNTSRPVGIDIFYNNNSNQQLNSSFNYNYQFNNNKQQPALTLLCTNTECAQYLSKQMMKAKVLYEKHLQIKRVNNCKNDGKKKIFPIFTI